MRQDPQTGLTEEQLSLAKSLTKEVYINQGREQFIRKYRQKPAIGLAAIGSPEALKTLRDVSERARGIAKLRDDATTTKQEGMEEVAGAGRNMCGQRTLRAIHGLAA